MKPTMNNVFKLRNAVFSISGHPASRDPKGISAHLPDLQCLGAQLVPCALFAVSALPNSTKVIVGKVFLWQEGKISVSKQKVTVTLFPKVYKLSFLPSFIFLGLSPGKAMSV